MLHWARSSPPRPSLQRAAAEVSQPTDVVLVTHDSFAISPDVKKAFEEESGLKLEILKAGDAGEVVTRALLTAGNPEGDVLFGFDNNLLARVLAGDVFEPYRPPELATVDPALVLDPEHRATPIDRGDVCLNYDKGWYASRGITPPRRLADLALPRYRDQLVVENPATSTPGLAFMLATIAEFGRRVEGLLEQAPRQRRPRRRRLGGRLLLPLLGLGGSKGNRPVVVSYASSPPAEVIFAEAPAEHRTDRRRRGELLPPDRVRGRAARARRTRRAHGSSSTSCSRSASRRTSRCRCSCSRRGRMPPCRRSSSASRSCPRIRSSFRPQRSIRTASSWVDTWTDTVVR